MKMQSEKEFRKLADRTSVVLAGTLYGGNIGSVARSMNTFGFKNLILVSSRCGKNEDAFRMAVNSREILDSALEYDDLATALEGFDVIIGTTRRRGRKRSSYYTPPAMAGAIKGLDGDSRVAIVFGPEDKGLSNEHLDLCPWLVFIQTFSDFDSLNLSHAVTVLIYEISRQYMEPDTGGLEDARRLEGLFEHIDTMLRQSGFLPPGGDPRRAMLTLRRMIGRGKWSRGEIDLFHSVLNGLEKGLK